MNDVEKYQLRYAKGEEVKCMMILKDGTEFEVPIFRKEEDGKGKPSTDKVSG